ncbi:MAG: hypothetical protein ACRDQ0_12290 [Pseudonocardia sp.]
MNHFPQTDPTPYPGPPSGHRSMPGALIAVLVVLGLQVLAWAALGVLFLALIDDGRYGTTLELAWFGSTSLLFAAIGAVCFVGSVRPRRWARRILITLEAIGIASAVVNLISGTAEAAISILLAAAIIGLLSRSDVRDWYC